MSAVRRPRAWRATALGAAALGALVTLGAARWAGGRYDRAATIRSAAAAAAYLALLTPADSTGFDLARLLVEARALASLPGWSGAVEVYHGTAPLVMATAPPLDPATFDSLRATAAPQWQGGWALVPLKDRRDREVVGAVARRPGGVGGGWRWWWTAIAALAALLGARAAARAIGAEPGTRRRALTAHVVAAGLLGVAAYGIVHRTARASTDRWLEDARLLIQEAVARTPASRVTTADLARIARGGRAELGPGTGSRSRTGPARRVIDGARRAVVTARLDTWGGRAVELRAIPAEATAGGWLALTLGLALLAPLATQVLASLERMAGRPRERRETVTAWAFLAPAGLHLVVFSCAPMLFVLYLSVHRGEPGAGGLGGAVGGEPVFVGLANFGALMRDPLAWISLRNTALYTLSVPLTMALALGAALVLNRRSTAAGLIRTAILLPAVSSVVAGALVWQWMLGLGPVDWLGSPRTALPALMLISVWSQVGYQMVVFLAGLQGIPRGYLDAARVDGASGWHRFWRVIFPLLRPVTLFVLVSGVIGCFQVFTTVYVLTGGGPQRATDLLAHRLYQTAWGAQQFGQASALALLVFVILLGVTWTQFRLLGKRVKYG